LKNSLSRHRVSAAHRDRRHDIDDNDLDSLPAGAHIDQAQSAQTIDHAADGLSLIFLDPPGAWAARTRFP